MANGTPAGSPSIDSWLVAMAAVKSQDEPAGEPEHPLRRKILRTIQTRLGINEIGIQKATGLKRSTVRHHLRTLIDAGFLRRYPIGRENHYFPAETESVDVKRLSAATHGRAKKILKEVFLHPGLSQAEIARRTGLTRKILRSYLDVLVDHGLIEETRGPLAHEYWPGESVDAMVCDRVLRNPGPAPASRQWGPPRPDHIDRPRGPKGRARTGRPF